MKIFTSIVKTIFKDFLYFVVVEYFPLQPQVFSNSMTFLLLIWMIQVYIAGGENFVVKSHDILQVTLAEVVVNKIC